MRGYVNKELAQKGLISKTESKLYNKLMDHRSDADYNNEMFLERDIAADLLEGVKSFNESIRLLINRELSK